MWIEHDYLDPIRGKVTERYQICGKCYEENATEENTNCETRYSLGIYAGVYCDKHWRESGYRDAGPEGYDYLDAGEYYDENDY